MQFFRSNQFLIMSDETTEQSKLAEGLVLAVGVSVKADAPAETRKTAAEFEMILQAIREENKQGRVVDLPAVMAAVRTHTKKSTR